jgi:pimeloyl-ACP methyl ester carboxylesterase/protein-S-isoprenylcysteine O-methyltransferase Ste14
MLTRALLAFLALPGLVAFLIPLVVLRPAESGFRWVALVPLAAGTGLLLWCVREFYVAGKGTLAPWDPPRHLVTSGLYRYTRNPMYLAVLLILIGWALGFASTTLWLYSLAVMLAFFAHVVWLEEPYLARTHHEQWKRYAARVPRWIFPSRRAVFVAWAAFLIALPIGGLIYEAIADGLAQREFQPPGTLVDIGGRRLHLLCSGRGGPIVLFEHSGWGSSLSGSQVRARLESQTTVCSYDRSGYGWSDPAAENAVSTGDLVRDLAVLQDRAKLQSPFILVASSIGGLTAELFARQHPERTAGLVMLDAANSETLSLRERYSRWIRPAACASGMMARLGVIRLLDPFHIGVASDDARRGSAITYNARLWNQLCAMARGLPDTVREFREATPLRPDLPLIVLSASNSENLAPPGVQRLMDVEQLRATLIESHQQFAKRSTRGKWMMVPKSTHLIYSSQPEAVADAILEMLEEIR